MVFNDLVKPFAGAVALAIAPVLLAVAVFAQTAPPAPGQAPAAGKMEPAPAAQAPAPAAQSPASGAGAAGDEAGATAPGKNASSDPLLGLEVIGSDGKSVGEVAAVKAGPDGKVSEIHVKTGTFLGFGGKTVAIPASKVTKSGETLKVAMSSADVGKLPKLDVNG